MFFSDYFSLKREIFLQDVFPTEAEISRIPVWFKPKVWRSDYIKVEDSPYGHNLAQGKSLSSWNCQTLITLSGADLKDTL